MKRIAMLLILIIAFASVASSEEKKDETKYEVTINVTYNAVSPEEAVKIISDAQIRHKTACKTEIKSKKVEGLSFSTLSVGSTLYTLCADDNGNPIPCR